jgi:hypothetical protein
MSHRIKRLGSSALALAALSAVSSVALAEGLLSPSDFIIAIDRDIAPKPSSYPTPNETPAMVLDTNTGTKYLNFGEQGSGFIVTPSAASILKSFSLSTANDAAERDPASYQLFGTNLPITSLDNSAGTGEAWTMISSGALSLPTTRTTLGPIVDVTNNTSYGSYKLLFPTVRNPVAANSMQISDAQFFTGAGGTGTPILAVGNPILGIDDPSFNDPQSSYPTTERPLELIDNIKFSPSKYLNFGRENSGVIITPTKGKSIATGIQMWSANDVDARDPSAYEIWGTNAPITSGDNSTGEGEVWTLITSGSYTLPTTRNGTATESPGPLITFANDTAYTSYKIIFPENRGPDTAANSIQVSELQLEGTVVPEPAALGLVGLGMVALAGRRRKA